MKFLLTLALVLVASLSLVSAGNPEEPAVLAAAQAYASKELPKIPSVCTFQAVSGDYARVLVTLKQNDTDPGILFLKKIDGKWQGLTIGTGFGPEDYRELGIPKGLWLGKSF